MKSEMGIGESARIGQANESAGHVVGSAAELCHIGLLEIGRLIAAREISPVEVTEMLLRRIDSIDPTLQSYVQVTADMAMAQARAAEREIAAGGPRSLVHGVPIGIKDMFDIRGVRTAAGMSFRRDYVAEKDATVVRRLRQAGAIFLGTLKMTEGAHAEHSPSFGAPTNPWNGELWPGASSSGSGVATAAGLCYAALGSDTGGSIRLPAAANGVTGLMPTWGRVSRAGVFELAAMLDHVGPLARSAADAGAVLGVIAGPDPDDPTASLAAAPDYLAALDGDLRSFRIGLDEELAFEGTDASVEKSIRNGLDVLIDCGARVVAIRAPDFRPMMKAYLPLSGVQTALAHAATYPSRADEYGPALSSVIALGRSISGMEYHTLLLRQMEFRCRLDALFQIVDLLVIPVLSIPVPTASQAARMTDEVIAAVSRFTCPIDMSGHPAIAFPCGFGANGGPVSMQLVGPNFGEPALIKAADAFQRQTDWHRRRPPL
jgi:amidase